jgi:cytochrome c5
VAAAAPAKAADGKSTYDTTCMACHSTGAAGAPKLGDKAAWKPRLAQGINALHAAALKGKGAMPPKGGNPSLTDDEVARAVAFMANQSGAKFKEPAGKQPAQKPQAGAADGKKVFDTVCTVCHTAGVAGAPKPGDKAAWAPRIKQGTDALVQSVIKGKGAMPPRAGNASLSDAEIRAAVEFMVSQAK